MDRTKAAEILHKAKVCYATEYLDCHMVCDMCKYHVEDSLVVEAIDTAIKALDKDIDVPAKSALDHIHNVVSEREYQRGYEQAKEEYDHKLTEIKSRIKDHYYNKGYKQGKADAEKEMHDNIMRYRMPEPWEGEANG